MTDLELQISDLPEQPAISPKPDTRNPVLRNTLFLSIGQIAGVPLSILINAVTARYLGPAALGYMYLAATFNTTGFLVVDWGQSGALPALVAADRTRAGRLLGATLVWRCAMSVVVYGVLMGVCRFLGYTHEVRVVVTLFFIGYVVSAISNACQFVITGFERIDIVVYRQILEQFTVVVIVVPILLLGGGVNAVMIGNAAVTVVVLLYVWRALSSMNIGPLSVDLSSLNSLVRRGTPFLFVGVAMVLQPSVDAGFLSKLAPDDVVGWYSAARRLIGFLVFPVSALAGALYPTLCRLQATNTEAFKETANSALRATGLLVMPVALGCVLFPDLGIALYDRTSFLPAEDDLRFLSIYLFLLYFTMPLGISIMAAGGQRAWAIVQCLCVVVSLVLDPILVPLFQQRAGNGGLGLCVAAAVSETIVLGCGVWLAPRGVFDRRFWRSFVAAVLSGGAMVVAARILRPVTPWVAAPIAVAAYGGCLWMTGGFDKAFVASLTALIGPRLARFRQTPPGTTV